MPKLLSQPKKWLFFSIFLLGMVPALLSLLAMMHAGIPFAYQGDSSKYIRPAMGLLTTGHYGYVTAGVFHPELERLPFYPLLIAFNYYFFGMHNDLAVALSQCFLVGGIVLAVSLTVDLFDSRFVIPAAILTALCPNIFFRAAIILPDLMFVFFTAWGLWLFLYAVHKRSIVFFYLSVIVFGLSMMVRPVFLLYPILTLPCVLYFLMDKFKYSLVKACGCIFLSFVLFGLILSPQLIREKQQTGSYMLTTQSGTHLLFWIYPCLETKWGGKRDIPALHRAQAMYASQLAKLDKQQQNDPVQVQALKKQLAMQLIYDIPLPQLITASLGSTMKLLFYTSALAITETFHHNIPRFVFSRLKTSMLQLLQSPAQIYILLSQLGVLLCRMLQCIGIFYGLRHKTFRTTTLYLLLGGLSYVVISIGLGNPRYRAPIEPLFVLLTVFGLIPIWNYLRLHYLSPNEKHDFEIA